jgi:hypothetical protein
VLLQDAQGDDIDYLQVHGYNAQQTVCELQYPWQAGGNQINNGTKFIARNPDGTGDWQGQQSSNIQPTPGEDNNNSGGNYFRIKHRAEGLVCAEETITIESCTDASCTQLNSQTVSVDFILNGVPQETLTFSESIDHSFAYSSSTTPAQLAVSGDYHCSYFDLSPSNCQIVFNKAGFVFSMPAGGQLLDNQVAGEVFELEITVVAEDEQGQCQGVITGEWATEFTMVYQQPSTPTTNSYLIENTEIAKSLSAPPQTATSISLNYSNDSSARFSNRYDDAGQISLYASLNLDGELIQGQSTPFWVRPQQLKLATDPSLTSADASGIDHHPAGKAFIYELQAVNAFGQLTTNYHSANLQFDLAMQAPLNSADGGFYYGDGYWLQTGTNGFVSVQGKVSDFVAGVSRFEQAYFSEVGVMALDVRDNNYGFAGDVVSLSEIALLGRFTPSYFQQSVRVDTVNVVDYNGNLQAPAGFAYSGERQTDNLSANGVIGYGQAPQLHITPYNELGEVTQNYIGDFQKLSAADISVITPTADNRYLGSEDLPLTIEAELFIGELQADTLAPGEMDYIFSASDHYRYRREQNALVAPFKGEIELAVESIVDNDGILAISTENPLVQGPIDNFIRFGRWVIDNGFGPETSPQPLPMQIEEYDGSGFIVNKDENLVSFDATDPDNLVLTYDNLQLPLLPGVITVSGSGFFVTGKTRELIISASSDGSRGQVRLEYQAPSWLDFNWSEGALGFNENPRAVATLGLYRGNDRILYRRESR